MFHDLSQTLKAILSQSGLPTELKVIQISFDRPDGKFIPQQTTLNLFLYDIRENVELRDSTPLMESDRVQGRLSSIVHPHVWIALFSRSYPWQA
jgi:Pvc16 N-terminal domain